MQTVEDAELMRRYAAGSTPAFDALYARHEGALYRFLLRQCGNPARAADLFQEVWLRVVNARHRYEPRAKFRTWLFTIAHHCWLDALRAQGHDATHAAEPIGPGEVFDAPSPTRTPEALAADAQAVEAFAAALAALPEEQRTAFVLREETEMSLEEMAEVTGVGAETVKSRLRYATARLRQALAAHGAATDGETR